MCTTLCLRHIHHIYVLGLYNSSLHNLIIHYTYNLLCCHTAKVNELYVNDMYHPTSDLLQVYKVIVIAKIVVFVITKCSNFASYCNNSYTNPGVWIWWHWWCHPQHDVSHCATWSSNIDSQYMSRIIISKHSSDFEKVNLHSSILISWHVTSV